MGLASITKSIFNALADLFSGPKIELAEPNVASDWRVSRSWAKWAAPLAIVRGESNYLSELTAIAGEPRRNGYLKPVTATLKREPANEYDRQAIAIYVDDRRVGYIAKEIASQLSPVMDKGKCSEFQLAGIVRGGYSRRPNFGVCLWTDKLISPGPELFFDKVVEKKFSAPSWPPDEHEGLSNDEVDALLETKPATPMQREFYKFFNIPIPKALKQKEALSFQNDYCKRYSDERAEEFTEWEAFEELFEEINEEFQDDIKKVGLSDYRAAFKAAKEESTVEELQSDPAIIVDKLIEIKPSLERS